MNFNPWLFGWPSGRGALGGDVTQSISPLTNLFSPQIEFNFKGDRGTEADVVANVASYGKQLGWLIEAVLALADHSDPEAIERIRRLEADVKRVKDRERGTPGGIFISCSGCEFHEKL